MAAGVIIGRVAIKVIPDTSRFREELERDLNRIERDLEPIEIDINVDTDTVVQEAKAARQKAQDQMKDLRLKVNLDSEDSIKRSLQQLNREMERLGEVDIDVDLNEDDLRAAMDLLNEQLEAVRTITLDVDEANPRDVAKAVDAINQELEKIKRVELTVALNEQTLTDTRDRLRDKMDETYRQIRDNVQNQLKNIQIGMDVDPVQAARTIRKIELILEQIEDLKMTIKPDMDERSRFATLRKIQDLRDQVSDMQATIHPDLDSPAALALSARLALLARDRFVEYIPRVNRAAATAVGMALTRMSGARIIGGYMRDLYNSIIQFDKAVPKVIGLSTAVGGLGIMGLAASSNLFALSASLASIAPAALALPGIFGGAAVGVGVMVAALKDFNKVFPDVQDTLANMQDSISDNFWAGAKDSMREMIDTLMPRFKAGFDAVATSLGNFSSKLTTALTNDLAPALAGMFDDLRSSIDIASGSAGAISGIITTLGEVGASYLPRLAQWFVDITTQFDNFLTRSTQSGDIFTWIDNGVQALKDLWNVGKNAYLILSDIADAAQAAGGSSLGMLAAGLERIRDVTSSAGFKDGLTEVFRSAHVAMDYIVSNSGPGVTNLFKSLGTLIPAILPTIGAAIGEMIGAIADALAQPEVSQGITDMFEDIRVGIAYLTPAFAPLARAIATMGPLVGELAKTLGEVLGAAIPPVADALVRMGEALEPLVPVMGDLLLSAVEALAPVVTNLSNAFVAIMDNGGLQFLTDTATLLSDILTAFPSSVLTIIAATVLGLSVTAMIAGAGMSVLAAATGAFGTALAIVTSPITAIIIAIGLVIAIGYVLIKHWDDIKVLADMVWNKIKDKVSEAWSQMKTTVATKAAEIYNAVREKWTQIKADTDAKWEAVKAAVAAKIAALKADAEAKWEALKASISAKMSSIKSDTDAKWEALKAAVSAKISALKADAEAKWEALKASISAKISALKADVEAKIEAMKAGVSAKFSALKSDAESKFEALKAGLQAKAEAAKAAVVAKFAELVTQAVAKFQEIKGRLTSIDWSGALVSAGQQLVRGFINGIQGMAGAAVSAVASMAGNAIAAAKAKLNINSPSKVFIGIGQSVGEGLVDGIVASTRDVTKAVERMSESVAEAFNMPDMADMNANLPTTNVRKGLVGSVRTAVTESTDKANGKTLIYHAAPGSSLGAEEDLFAAADRGRMVGW